MERIYKKTTLFESVKEYVLYILLLIVDLFYAKHKAQKTNEKWILIVKLDLLGDYILLRNFFENIKKHPDYKNHKIAYCCFAGVQELSQFLDRNIIDEWIPLKLKPFISTFSYRKSIWKRLKDKHYDLAIFPTQSRSFFYDDYIAKTIMATQKIASQGNSYNHTQWQEKKAKNYYTRLIEQTNHFAFEFDLNRHYFENLLSEKIALEAPKIALPQNIQAYKVLIAPGASADFRRWSTQNFIEIIKYILEKKPNAQIIISGAPSEKPLCNQIENAFKDNNQVKNACGHLSLSELSLELSTCQFIISNESGLVHFAKAVGVPFVYCISNGNHFKRFNPYPKKDPKSTIRYFYPPEFEALLQENESMTIQKYYWGSRISIEGIKPAHLVKYLEKDLA